MNVKVEELPSFLHLEMIHQTISQSCWKIVIDKPHMQTMNTKIPAFSEQKSSSLFCMHSTIHCRYTNFDNQPSSHIYNYIYMYTFVYYRHARPCLILIYIHIYIHMNLSTHMPTHTHVQTHMNIFKRSHAYMPIKHIHAATHTQDIHICIHTTNTTQHNGQIHTLYPWPTTLHRTW